MREARVRDEQGEAVLLSKQSTQWPFLPTHCLIPQPQGLLCFSPVLAIPLQTHLAIHRNEWSKLEAKSTYHSADLSDRDIRIKRGFPKKEGLSQGKAVLNIRLLCPLCLEYTPVRTKNIGTRFTSSSVLLRPSKLTMDFHGTKFWKCCHSHTISMFVSWMSLLNWCAAAFFCHVTQSHRDLHHNVCFS